MAEKIGGEGSWFSWRDILLAAFWGLFFGLLLEYRSELGDLVESALGRFGVAAETAMSSNLSLPLSIFTLAFALWSHFSRRHVIRAHRVEANRIEVHDPKGRTKALLTVRDDGRVGLAMADQNQQARAIISVSHEGAPTISLLNSTGNPLVAISETAHAAGMLLTDPNTGEKRLVLGLSHGHPALSFYNARGNHLANFGESERGNPGAQLLDDNGSTRLSLSLDSAGNPAVTMADAAKNPRLHIAANQASESEIVAFDAGGKVTWNVP